MSRFRVSLFLFSIITIALAVLFNPLLQAIMNGNSTVKPAPLAPVSKPPGVIIVGSGLAGLSASSQLIHHGIPVTMLERAAKAGGNTIKASSGINGAPTRFQDPNQLDYAEEFYKDTVKSAGKPFWTQTERREKLISTLTNESAGAITWLVDQGIDLSKVTQLGGHSKPRTHRGKGRTPPGAAIVSTLLKALQSSPLFELKTGCTATKLPISNQGTVEGVQYSCNTLPTSPSPVSKIESEVFRTLNGPVIFCAGGFAGDAHGLLAQYRPDLMGLPSTNDARPGALPLLQEISAGVVDVEHVQVHPTGFVDPHDPGCAVKFLAAELLRGEGGILLRDGKRFVNELGTREEVSAAIMGDEDGVVERTPVKQWSVVIVLDEGAYEAAKGHVDFYLWKELMHRHPVEDLGPWATMVVQEYADAVFAVKEDPLGRTSFGNWKLRDVKPDSVVYTGIVTPVVHFTMGGVSFNERAEVLRGSGESIKGLWAAGEVTGGVHGANRLGGSSLLECVVFGRRAGDEAAKYYKDREKEKVNGS